MLSRPLVVLRNWVGRLFVGSVLEWKAVYVALVFEEDEGELRKAWVMVRVRYSIMLEVGVVYLRR